MRLQDETALLENFKDLIVIAEYRINQKYAGVNSNTN